MKRNNIIFAAILIWSLTMGKSGNIMALNHYNSVFNETDSIDNYRFPILMFSEPENGEEKENKDEEEIILRNYSHIPNSVEIDITKAVGEIPIISAVTPTGAITYTVPIEVYPGINGMQPDLSLVYNSHAGNGFMGMGWNLAGISMITRGNKSMYYDTNSQGVKRNKDDAFYLDGIRLIKISEQPDTIIRYESEQGNIKVKAKYRLTLNKISIVQYFEVYYPNGTKGTYGDKTNTNINYLEYPLTELSDLYGNRIMFFYTHENNLFRIISIGYNYANATNSSNLCLIDFIYESRNDVPKYYIGGLETKKSKRLERIVCRHNGNILRTYKFDYIYRNSSSLVEKINYLVGYGQSYNPLRFYYGTNNNLDRYSKNTTNLNGLWWRFSNPDLLKLTTGRIDFNSDDAGLIAYRAKNPYKKHYNNAWFENQYKINDTIIAYRRTQGSMISADFLLTGDGFIDVFAANPTGIGSDDIIKINNIRDGNIDRVIIKGYHLVEPNAGNYTEKYTRTYNFNTVLTDSKGNKSIHPKYYFSGDFLGNGKTQVLAISSHNPIGGSSHPTKMYLFDLESNSTSPIFSSTNQTYFSFEYNVIYSETNDSNGNVETNGSDRIRIMDLNGDGKTDICLINNEGAYIYSFEKQGSTYVFGLIGFDVNLTLNTLKNKSLYVGDFNGDGKSDLLLSPTLNNNNWFIYYSTGFEFERVATSPFTVDKGNKYFVQDINSDGMSDVIEYYETRFGTSLATGTGLTSNLFQINFDTQMKHP